nr:hypothetical protein [Enterocloster clostridioformis]
MKLKTDDPFVPENIRVKINGLQSLLDRAADLYSDIYDWYDRELKSYDPKATADDELFDPGTGTVVEGIDYLAIMESLSELDIFCCILLFCNHKNEKARLCYPLFFAGCD